MNNSTPKQINFFDRAQIACKSGYWQWIDDHQKIYFTNSAFALFGLPASPDNIIGVDEVNKLVHPSDSVAVQKLWRDIKDEKKVDQHYKIVTLAGEIKHIHMLGECFEAENGERITQGCCKDVTQERQTTGLLKDYADELELQLKTFLRAEQVALTGTWQIDLNNHETFFSDNIYRLYGLVPQSMPAHLNTFTAYIHPEDKKAVTDASEMAFNQRFPLHLEYRIIRTDGVIRHLRVVSEITKGLMGEELLTGISHDITEQKQLELQLKATNENLDIQNKHFRQAEQIAHVGTWQVSLETRISYYSDNLYRLYGLRPGVTRDQLLDSIYNEDKARVNESIRKSFEEHLLPNINFRIVRSDGKLRYLQQTAKFVTNAEGEQVMIGVVQDITEQQLMGAKLQELNQDLSIQNEAFTHAEQTANIGTWRWNLDTNNIFYSDNIYRLHGLKPQAVAPGYETFQKYVHPDDVEKLKDLPATMQKEGVAREVDYRIYRADGELRYLKDRNRLYISPEGERVMIGTTQDVTEEALLQQKLDEQLRFVKLLSNNLVDQVLVTDTANIILEFNKAAEKLHSTRRDMVIGKNLFEVFPQLKSPQVIGNYKRALKGEMVHDTDISSPLKQGFIERFHIPVKGEDQQVVGVLTVVRDVTKEYQLRQQLTQRLGFIRNLVDASGIRIIALDKDLNYTLWNKESEKHYGLTEKAVIGKNVLQFYPSFKKDPFFEAIQNCLSGEEVYMPPSTTEKDGYHETHLIPLKDHAGEINGVLWLIHDLTERRAAEKQVQEGRNLLRQIADASPDAITVYNLEEQQAVYINDRLAEWIGISSERLTEIGVEGRLLLIHPDDRKRLLDFTTSLKDIAEEEIRQIKYRILNKQKQYRWVLNRSKVFSRDIDGKPKEVVSVLLDVTQAREMEEQLRQEHRRLKEAQAVGHVGSFEWDPATDVIYWSDEMYRIHGLEPVIGEHVTLGKVMSFIHPDDLDDTARVYSKCRREASNLNITHRIIRADGEIRYLHRNIRSVANEKGQVIHLSGMVQDVTDRIKAEREIIENRELLQTTIDSSFDMIQVFKAVRNDKGEIVDFRYVLLNEGAKKWMGDVVGESLLQQQPGVIAEGIFESFKQVVETGIPQRYEKHYVHEQFDGWFSQSVVKLYDGVATTTADITLKVEATVQNDAEGNPYKVVGVDMDIMKVKEAAEKLQLANDELQHILNAIPHYIWTSLPNGIQLFHNAHWVRTSGIDPDTNPDAWLATIHPDDLERTRRLWQQAISSGTEYYNEVRIINTQNQYRWHIAKAVPLKDSKGNIRLWVGTSTDIHDLKLAENRLAKR